MVVLAMIAVVIISMYYTRICHKYLATRKVAGPDDQRMWNHRTFVFHSTNNFECLHMPGTVLGNGTGKKTEAPSHCCHNIAYIYVYFERTHKDQLIKFIALYGFKVRGARCMVLNGKGGARR